MRDKKEEDTRMQGLQERLQLKCDLEEEHKVDKLGELLQQLNPTEELDQEIVGELFEWADNR